MASAAIFSPLGKPPTEHYLSSARTFLLSDQKFQPLVREFQYLGDTWKLLASQREDIAALTQGPRYTKLLSEWISHGRSGPITDILSGIVSIPVLMVVEICQYFQYLQQRGIGHREFMNEVKGLGGVQGYCGGLLPASAVACAEDEEEVIQLAATAMRVGLAIGAFGQLGDDEATPGATVMVLRARYPGQGEEIVAKFPGCYISAVTDPKSISIVGPVHALGELAEYARGEGIHVQKMHLRGKVHNPENKDLAAALCSICDQFSSLQLPRTSQLRVPFRSNFDGQGVVEAALHHEVVKLMLVGKCEWYRLLENLAQDLKGSGIQAHTFASFGLGDCVPLAPFHQAKLSITKVDASRIMTQAAISSYDFNDNAIAVIGASCRLPGASSLEELWDLLSQAESRCEPIRLDRVPMHRSFRASQDKSSSKRTYFGNFVDSIDQFDCDFFRMSAKEASYMDPQQRLLLELAYEAMDSSGYLRHQNRSDNDNVGCFIGSGFVEYLDNTNSHAPTAFSSTGAIRAFLCGRLSYYFGWKGPAEVLDTACSSSMIAIHRACRAILGGECPMAIAGGVNVMTGVNNHMDLAKAGFLSPTGQCKPFDASADGYCRSDGAGLVVLKRLSDARAAGDQILGVIVGSGTNQGGTSATITVPHAPALVDLYRRILGQAGMDPGQVTYVEAHGTGTQAGDPVEVSSIRQVFGGGDRLLPLHLGSIKGNIGHCEPAAGIAGLIKILSMLRVGQIPPLASFSVLNPKIPPLGRNRITIDRSVQRWPASFKAACVNSYGAAGSNGALICCQPPPSTTVKTRPGQAQEFPILVTAHSEEALLQYTSDLAALLGREKVGLGDLAFTLSERRMHHRYRWMTVSSDTGSLLRSLGESKTIFEKPSNRKPVVLAFAGQSEQFVGLDPHLYETCPRLRHHIDMCCKTLTDLGYPSAVPAIFQKDPISDTVLLQTAIFSMQYSFARCWINSGLQVDAVLGHSLGELTAITVSGVWGLADGLRFVAARAKLIDSKWGPERGSMLAIHAKKDIVLGLTSGIGGCEVACFNSQSTQVVAGSSQSLKLVESALASDPQYQGIRHQTINTTHGFHSNLTEPLLQELSAVAETLSYNEPEIYLETCTAGGRQKITPDHVTRHTRDAVYFHEAVQRLSGHLGPCVWVEAGSNSPIIAMLKSSAPNSSSHTFQPLNFRKSAAKESVLSNAVLSLWMEGLDVSFWPFLTPQESGLSQISLPPYVFRGTSAWVENIDRATEAREMLKDSQGEGPVVEQARPAKLVTGPEKNGNTMLFGINTRSVRFKSIVSGHAVRNRPLCPASMYMECAAMALQNLGIDLSQSQISFEDLSFASPLGVDPNGVVTLALEEANASGGWQLCFQSRPDASGRPTVTTHMSGSLKVQQTRANLGASQRLVLKQVEKMSTDSGLERFMDTRAYALFSTVVTYAGFLRGMKNIAIDGCQALAEVHLPDGQVGLEESTAVGECDTVSLDIFIQVLGLTINSSDLCDPSNVYVATGIENATLPAGRCFLETKAWKVFVQYTPIKESQATGDVFVLSQDGLLVMSITGVSFTKVPISKLKKMLDAATTSAHAKSHAVVMPQRPTLPKLTSLPKKPAPVPQVRNHEGIIKDMLSSFTGAHIDMIKADTHIADLGLDSLAAVELADDLQVRFCKEISSTDILDCRVSDLLLLTGSPSPTTGTTEVRGEDAGDQSTDSGSLESLKTPPSPTSEFGDTNSSKFLQLICEASGATSLSLGDDATLRELGVDSLAAMELKDDIENAYSIEVPDGQLDLDLSLGHLARELGVTRGTLSDTSRPTTNFAAPHLSEISASTPPRECNGVSGTVLVEPAGIYNPMEALAWAEAGLHTSLRQQGIAGPSPDAERMMDAITTLYILSAFKHLGADLSSMPAGQEIAPIPHLPSISKAIERYHHILQKHGLIESDGRVYIRTTKDCPEASVAELLASLTRRYPGYGPEAGIISLTGPKLAACLTGKELPVSLLFGSQRSREVLAEYYANSPLLATATALLVDLITRTVAESKGDTIRIIEVGAGFGGTTRRLAQALEAQGKKVEYTFTDISPTLVSCASKTLGHHKWMSFQALDLEKEPAPQLQGKFDIAIGTNCVHATSEQVTTLRNVRKLLNSHGCLILSEVTKIHDWYDVVFGLLDGWWLSKDGSYPLQPEDKWMKAFQAAGFQSTTYSKSSLPGLDAQRLLLGTMQKLPIPPKMGTSGTRIETVVYKKIQGVEIGADIYLPGKSKDIAMPVAIMIHGGGHMMLSKKAIRPAQTAHLLQNGILPVSFDYRLCPEINLIDGPIADIRDAYLWTKNKLPVILSRHAVKVDTTRIGIIGWSTGGHLAMTTAWSSKSLGADPPKSILSFYGPTDFESGALDTPRFEHVEQDQGDLGGIIRSLSHTPITSYTHGTQPPDAAELGWIRRGDPRSELVISLFKNRRGLSLLLNDRSPDDEWYQRPPDPSRVAAINPMAHVRGGDYNTPTMLVHGTRDEVAPFGTAAAFVKALRERGVDCGFLALPDGRHLHDMRLKPGTAEWEEQVAPAYEFFLKYLRE